MKTDPRTRYTKSVIQESFLQLLRKKPMSKVTVSEICQVAEINRGTFYRYYLDVYDLGDQMMDEGLERFRALFDRSSENDFISAMAAMLRYLKEDRQLFYMLMSEMSSEKVQSSFFEKIFMIGFEQIKNQFPEETLNETRLLTFISGGAGALVLYWLRSDNNESAEEMARLINEYASVVIRHEIQKAADA